MGRCINARNNVAHIGTSDKSATRRRSRSTRVKFLDKCGRLRRKFDGAHLLVPRTSCGLKAALVFVPHAGGPRLQRTCFFVEQVHRRPSRCRRATRRRHGNPSGCRKRRIYIHNHRPVWKGPLLAVAFVSFSGSVFWGNCSLIHMYFFDKCLRRPCPACNSDSRGDLCRQFAGERGHPLRARFRSSSCMHGNKYSGLSRRASRG